MLWLMGGPDDRDNLEAGWELDEADLEIATDDGSELDREVVEEEELEPYDSDEATLAYRGDQVPPEVANYLQSDAADGVNAPQQPAPVPEDMIVNLPPSADELDEPAPAPPPPQAASGLDADLLFDLGPDPAAPAPDGGAGLYAPVPEPFQPSEDTGEVAAPIRMAAHHLVMIVAGVLMGIAGAAMITTALLR